MMDSSCGRVGGRGSARKGEANDPNAMPLDEFIDEVMSILRINVAS